MQDACIVEASEVINAPAAHLFAVYGAVDQWALWDPETRAAYAESPLRIGSKGWLKPRQERAAGEKLPHTLALLKAFAESKARE